MTNSPDSPESRVVRSSVSPSAKYCCSASLDMLAKGSTAIDGLSVGTDAAGLGSAVSRSGFQPLQTNAPAPTSSTATNAAKAAASERRGPRLGSRRLGGGLRGDCRRERFCRPAAAGRCS